MTLWDFSLGFDQNPAVQSMPQFLNDFLLRQYALDDRVWAEITRLLITALDAVDAARSAYNRSGIVAYSVCSSWVAGVCVN